ncbi:MAG: phosphate regulon sensor histidine kinase PhoR [Pseudomonadota bacterium]|jgi:two-component system, OmpR family, phosphate regulon sensor histidine kinase PhoR
MYKREIWLEGLTFPILLAIAVFIMAYISMTAALWLLGLGSLALLSYHLYHLAQFNHWANSDLDIQAPEATGVWENAFSALYRRVKQRQSLQENLADALQKLRNATEAMPDGMVILNSAKHIEWCNRVAEHHLGINFFQDFDQPIANLVRQQSFADFLQSKDAAVPLELQSEREGAPMLSLQLIPYSEGRSLLLSRDISRIESLETVRQDFVANVSHELRTPITVLSGFLETFESTPLNSADAKKYIGLMKTQAENMQHLVENLLVLASLEAPDNSPEVQTIQIFALMTQLHADAQAISHGRQTIKIESPEHATLLGNKTEIFSAFTNLITNAIRYTPEAGVIILRWKDTPDAGIFEVVDNGIGIAAEHIPRLTERFYRVDRGRSRNTGGTGLGLAIVKHVALRHHAWLEVDSELGKGCTFRLVFPKAANPIKSDEFYATI